MATLKQVIECADQVVQGREDFVYDIPKHSRFPEAEMCSYSNKAGAPSCIVGQILYRLDPELFRQVAQHEKGIDESFSISEIRYISDARVEAGLEEFIGEAVPFLTKLQLAQDCGVPWGEALEIAKEAVA